MIVQLSGLSNHHSVGFQQLCCKDQGNSYDDVDCTWSDELWQPQGFIARDALFDLQSTQSLVFFCVSGRVDKACGWTKCMCWGSWPSQCTVKRCKLQALTVSTASHQALSHWVRLHLLENPWSWAQRLGTMEDDYSHPYEACEANVYNGMYHWRCELMKKHEMFLNVLIWFDNVAVSTASGLHRKVHDLWRLFRQPDHSTGLKIDVSGKCLDGCITL